MAWRNWMSVSVASAPMRVFSRWHLGRVTAKRRLYQQKYQQKP
ncbi:hypothetical protein ANDO1_0735 [plant metagenome]|uniref:Uncharacterized protein n=1 Tax=plant metagenome TaxID=1297885 RepID=A0A484Q1H0_9ZZZZ